RSTGWATSSWSGSATADGAARQPRLGLLDDEDAESVRVQEAGDVRCDRLALRPGERLLHCPGRGEPVLDDRVVWCGGAVGGGHDMVDGEPPEVGQTRNERRMDLVQMAPEVLGADVRAAAKQPAEEEVDVADVCVHRVPGERPRRPPCVSRWEVK